MRIYLDHNAGAPLSGAARVAMTEALAEFGNPSSIHRRGRAARAAIERARRQVAALVGPLADPVEQIVFTSGGTEALRAAIDGLAGPSPTIAVVATEHPAVHGAAATAAERGGCVVMIAVDGHGAIDPTSFAAALAARPAVVAVGAANHELGTIHDVVRWAAQARAAGARVVIDAVAAAGRMALGPIAGAADAVALSAHKLGGPSGVGALVLAPGLALSSPTGGHQERGRRAGTENLYGIVGFGAAAAAVDLGHGPAIAGRAARLEAAILAIDGARIHGAGTTRTGATVNAGFAGVRGETLVMALDLLGIEVSSGAACSSGSTAPSPVLRALGLDDEAARGGLRLSLGPTTTDDDIDRVIAVLPEVVARARRR